MIYTYELPLDGTVAWLSDLVGVAWGLNLAVFVPACAFVCLALAMLVHWALWPLIARPVYYLQRIGIPLRKKLLAGIGIALLLLAFPGAKEFLKALIP